MSKFVDEVVLLLSSRPDDFYSSNGKSVVSDIHHIEVSRLGNVMAFSYSSSIAELRVFNANATLQGDDKKLLEKAAEKWFKQAKLSSFCAPSVKSN